MTDYISENRNQLSRMLNSYQKLYKFKHIYLFASLKKGKVNPLLHVGLNSSLPLPLTLTKEISPIKEKCITSAEIQDEQLKKLFKHFDLQVICPLNIAEDKNYFLGVSSNNSELSDLEKQAVQLLSDNLKNILLNFRLKSELSKSARQAQQMISEMSALHEITRAFESSQNLDLLLKYILEKCMNMMNAEAASLMLVVENGKELEFKITLGPKSEEVKPFRLPMGKGISGWVAQNSEAILIPDAYADERFDPSFDKRSGFVTKSILCVPMIYKSKVIGVVTVLNRLDSKPFSENDKDILTSFSSQAALSIENAKLLQAVIEKERLDKELQVASEIQRLLIPQNIPNAPGLDISATYIPCKEVSGDFYDIIKLDEQRYIFIVADVSGKGIPGAMVVSTMQATLAAYLEYSNDLLSIIDKLNERIIKNTTSDRYITFFIGLYSSADSSLKYINAGHNPPLLINNKNETLKLHKGGIFIGYMPWQYESDTVTLNKDSILIMYTDGLVEAMNDAEEEFGEQRLIEIMRQHKGLDSKALQDKIIQAVNAHLGSNKLEDDFTLIVIKK
jgi:sigma-B regulation protein RsbU (phosphoserine phosphatase)